MVRLIRLSIFSLILFTSVMMTACLDSSTDPDPSEEDTIEATATISNPGDGDMLSGEITLSVQGEIEASFEELRIYLGSDLIETINNPNLPLDRSIETYLYDNGTYELIAELDVANPDTTISASVSVTLENYMVELESSGYIEFLKENYNAAYMFISDPQGNVLREVELTAYSDGVMKLLPPEQLSNGAPDHYNITIGQKTTDFQGRDAFYLDTYVELEPWSRIYKSRNSSVDPSPTRELTVEMNNFSQNPGITYLNTTEYIDINNYFYYGGFINHSVNNSTTINVPEGVDDLVITHSPDFNTVTNPVPLYKWEDDLTSLTGTMTYNATQDFTQMVSHDVTVPSNVEMLQYQYFMTVDPNSFDEGDISFASYSINNMGDANGSAPGIGIWVPQITTRSFITYFNGVDKNDANISYRNQSPVMNGFPNQFDALNAEVQITNKSLDNLELNTTGSPDYIRVSAEASTNTYIHRWSATLPNDTDSFVFPSISDSLDQSVANYSRSNFVLSQSFMSDIGKINGYSEYLDLTFGSTDYGVIIEFAQKIETLTSSPKQKVNKGKMIEQDAIFNFNSQNDILFRE